MIVKLMCSQKVGGEQEIIKSEKRGKGEICVPNCNAFDTNASNGHYHLQHSFERPTTSASPIIPIT